MFERKMNDSEKQLFMELCLPSMKHGGSEEGKGRLLYSMKVGKLTDKDLEVAFPDDWTAIKPLIEQKPLFGFRDRRNYVFDYFFKIHNKQRKCKVLPAQIVGFRAERKGTKNKILARVKHLGGEIEDSSIEVFPGIEKKDFTMHDYVLVHHGTICHRLTPDEHKQVMTDYFFKTP
jgi:hydrogenase maturation factor